MDTCKALSLANVSMYALPHLSPTRPKLPRNVNWGSFNSGRFSCKRPKDSQYNSIPFSVSRQPTKQSSLIRLIPDGCTLSAFVNKCGTSSTCLGFQLFARIHFSASREGAIVTSAWQVEYCSRYRSSMPLTPLSEKCTLLSSCDCSQ